MLKIQYKNFKKDRF